MKWLVGRALLLFQQKSFDECRERLQELLNIVEAVLEEDGNQEAEAVMVVEEGNRSCAGSGVRPRCPWARQRGRGEP